MSESDQVDELLAGLRSIAEPSRLRILVALAQTELTVGEICRVVDQSQPRVSRHLKLMLEAGVVRRHAQGTSAYFRLAREGHGSEVAEAVLRLVDLTDAQLGRDQGRLEVVREERADTAAAYFASVAAEWDQMRHLHVADEHVEQAMLDAVSDLDIADLLDVGTGTGRILELFAPHIVRGTGIDLSGEMLAIARSHLDTPTSRHCAVGRGSAYDLDVSGAAVDVVVLHHVLHFLDDPRAAIAEASRVLRPGGRLLIVDFLSHQFEQLRDEFAHRHLGFADHDIRGWIESAGLRPGTAARFPGSTAADHLDVVLWSAALLEHSPRPPQEISA